MKSVTPSRRSPVYQTGSVRPSTLEPEFRASSSSLGSLDAITIVELCLGKRHSGRVLHGQFPTEPLISELVDDIVTILVDTNADAIRVITSKSLWPRSPTGEIEEVFSLGKRVAIKEPVMEMSSNGMYAVRVTNLAEVVFLGDINAAGNLLPESTDAAALEEFKKMDIGPTESNEAISLKELQNVRLEGNGFFAEGKWLTAVNSYSQCIKAFRVLKNDGSTMTSSEADLKSVLMLAYSNRAEAWLRLQHYEDALRDADEALKIEPKHIKSLVRKGKAAHGLGLYETSCGAFKAALDESLEEQSIVEALTNSVTALEQSRTGEYDLIDLFLRGCRRERRVIPLCADFLGPVEIRRVTYGYGGRGLFATRRVTAGKVLLVSNPLAVVHHESEVGDDESELTAELVKQVTKSKRQIVRLLSLASHGQHEMEIPSMELFRPGSAWFPPGAEKLEVDLGLCRGIVSMNKTTWPTLKNGEDISDGYGFYSGVWVLPSFLNHSCAPNCDQSLVGEAMFLRATRDIMEGEELTISYFYTVDKDVETRRAEAQQWFFICDCERCRVEESLMAELSKSGAVAGSKRVVPEAESLSEEDGNFPINITNLCKILRTNDFKGVLQSCGSKLELELKQQRWIQASYLYIYDAKLQMLELVGDSKSRIDLLNLMLDSITSVCVCSEGLVLASLLLNEVEREYSKDSQAYRLTNDRVHGIHAIVHGITTVNNGKVPDSGLQEAIKMLPSISSMVDLMRCESLLRRRQGGSKSDA